MAARLVEVGGEEYIAIEFRRSLTAIDLGARVQVSNDLNTWRDNDSGGELLTEVLAARRASDGKTETPVVRAPHPIAGGREQDAGTFLRAVFELVTP